MAAETKKAPYTRETRLAAARRAQSRLEAVRGTTPSPARGGTRVARLLDQCGKLLGHRGQAAGSLVAHELLDQYAELDRQQQTAFFSGLLHAFSPDPGQVLLAAERYFAETSAENLAHLHGLVESPCQELLRRLNRAPGGTAAILRMRGHLLRALPEHPALAGLDWDFHHLLTSWFNPGFLKVVRVDWRTPASLLERIITHDAVHEIRGWEDLRRRLEADRRCFAFFHAALPEEPLIFVEVALVDAMPEAIAPLLDTLGPHGDPARARVAALYSINNCQAGLRGVSLGSFLVKQVVELLQAEFPRLRQFCTLSPVPGFRRWLVTCLRGSEAERLPALARALEAVAHALGTDLSRLGPDPAAALECLEPVRIPLLALCSTFLLGEGPEANELQDPVARFHLSNGARLERINWGADASRRGLHESLGMMVNYAYQPAAIVRNHERFAQGRISASHRATSLAIEG